jgi:hypothetical protein
MTTSHEGAHLVLRLYDLRREATMRAARDWYRLRFNPASSGEVTAVLEGPHNAFFRMVVSYWDMAAALVNHGAIDEALFHEVNVEHVGTFAKVEPFLADLRAATGNPDFLANLERLVMRLPDVKARLADVRERSRAAAVESPDTSSVPALDYRSVGHSPTAVTGP